MNSPIVDRDFADRFLRAVDRPMEYGVYQLFHDWWATAPQSAIDAYSARLASLPGADEFLVERHLADQISLDDLANCAPGTLGHGYRSFIIDNDLAANLATNYRDFNGSLTAAGTLDRLPDDLSYTIVRGFQIHDFLHVLTGHDPSPKGEIAMAAFHFAQLHFPYHAMRIAVTTGHVGFVDPRYIEMTMDAISTGWMMGRLADNLHFVHWENELDTPLDDLRSAHSIDISIAAAFTDC